MSLIEISSSSIAPGSGRQLWGFMLHLKGRAEALRGGSPKKWQKFGKYFGFSALFFRFISTADWL
jgi:hypothetical protein